MIQYIYIYLCVYPTGKGIPNAIATSVLSETNLSTVFWELEDHMVDTAVNENHIFGLIKTITKSYCKIRLYHLGKEYSQSLTGERVRKKLSKLVLFKHQ